MISTSVSLDISLQQLTSNALTRANLKLPLGWHDLGVDTRDLDPGVQASLVVGLNDVSAEDLARANTAVVWSLGCWETTLGPAVWPAIHAQDCVFLFQAKPRLVLGIRLHQSLTFMTIVEFVGTSIGVPGLGHDQDVVATSEGIGEDGAGANVDIGIVARSLTGR